MTPDMPTTACDERDARPAACSGCTLAEHGMPARRAFLRDAAFAALGTLVALGAAPERANALALRLVHAVRASGDLVTYDVPAADGAAIDHDREVILVRYQGALYAFALSCPHQRTALKWIGDEGRFQCPKHKSKYRPDGTFIEGRATRGMDRYPIRRQGEAILVDTGTLLREDEQADAWRDALLKL